MSHRPTSSLRALGRALLAASLLVSLNGCAKLIVGRRLDTGRLDEVQPLLSERAAVHELFGVPLRTQRLGDVTVEVHEYVTKNQFQCVLVSYRGDTVVSVDQVR